MKTMTVPARMENLDEILEMVETYLESYSSPAKSTYHVLVSVEELFTNIVSYAYEDESGQIEVSFWTDRNQNGLVFWIRIRDWGKPYDPMKKEDPDFEIPFEDREVGGLGIYMVKQFMDYLEYQHEDGCNMFQIGKRL